MDDEFDPDKDIEVLEKTTPYKGHFRIDHYRLRHKKYDGEWSPPLSREVFERGHAAAVLLYDPIRDEVVLIQQFRPGAYAAGLMPWLTEIVAGIIEPGETPEDVVRREAKEEAGVEITDLELIGRYNGDPGRQFGDGDPLLRAGGQRVRRRHPRRRGRGRGHQGGGALLRRGAGADRELGAGQRHGHHRAAVAGLEPGPHQGHLEDLAKES